MNFYAMMTAMVCLKLVWVNEIFFEDNMTDKTKLLAIMINILIVVLLLSITLNGMLPEFITKDKYSGMIVYCMCVFGINFGLFYKILKRL